jgi:hypothetical protein
MTYVGIDQKARNCWCKTVSLTSSSFALYRVLHFDRELFGFLLHTTGCHGGVAMRPRVWSVAWANRTRKGVLARTSTLAFNTNERAVGPSQRLPSAFREVISRAGRRGGKPCLPPRPTVPRLSTPTPTYSQSHSHSHSHSHPCSHSHFTFTFAITITFTMAAGSLRSIYQQYKYDTDLVAS